MARAVWQGIAVVAALVAWHAFSDDFATGALAAAVTFIAVSAIAQHRHGPLASLGDARREVLEKLQPSQAPQQEPARPIRPPAP